MTLCKVLFGRRQRQVYFAPGWHLCRTGHLRQTRSRTVPGFGWASFGWANCMIDTFVEHRTSWFCWSYNLASVPGFMLGSMCSLGSSAHIAPSGPITSTDQQGLSLTTGPNFPSPNPHYNPTFGSFDLVSSPVWWKAEIDTAFASGISCVPHYYLFPLLYLSCNKTSFFYRRKCWLFFFIRVQPCLIQSLERTQQFQTIQFSISIVFCLHTVKSENSSISDDSV